MCALEQETAKWQAGTDCTVYQIDAIKDEISASLKSENLTLDLSEIENFDASFVQLLIAAQVQAKKDNSTLVIEGITEELNNYIESMHCRAALDGLTELTGKE